MSLWNKKSADKTAKVAQTSLAELRQELQDMDIQIITYTHHRNAILEKIAYFENQLSLEVAQESSTPKTVVDKTNDKAEVQAA